MSMVDAIDLARGALFMVMYIAGPILLFGVAVGLMIALFQAVTSLQEQTLQCVPKIFAMALATGILIPVRAPKLVDYASALIWEPIPGVSFCSNILTAIILSSGPAATTALIILE